MRFTIAAPATRTVRRLAQGAIVTIAVAAGSVIPAAQQTTKPYRPSCGEAFPKTASTDELNTRCVALAGSLAAIRNGAIVLKMDDGTRKVFKDTTPEGDGYGYALVDFYPAFHIFVVGDLGDDGGKMTMVDGRTGRATSYGNRFPYLSPDGRLVLLDGSDASSLEPPTFSIVETAAATAAPLWSSTKDATALSSTTIRFDRWLGGDRLRFTLGKAQTPFFLVRGADGTWHYDLADDPEPQAPAPSKPNDKSQTPIARGTRGPR